MERQLFPPLFSLYIVQRDKQLGSWKWARRRCFYMIVHAPLGLDWGDINIQRRDHTVLHVSRDFVPGQKTGKYEWRGLWEKVLWSAKSCNYAVKDGEPVIDFTEARYYL